jgi:hypothetical protein
MKAVIVGCHVLFNAGKNDLWCHVQKITEAINYIKLYVGVVLATTIKNGQLLKLPDGFNGF